MESVREFETGAKRSADATRDDPEGFLSPLAIDRYCEYLNKHRAMPDGSVRDSDNWQLGMPLTAYAKGMWRHFLHFWTRHRGWPVRDPGASPNIEEDLCAIIFNAQGYLHELVKARLSCAAAEPAENRDECLHDADGYLDMTDGFGNKIKVRFVPHLDGTPVIDREEIAYYSSVLGPIPKSQVQPRVTPLKTMFEANTEGEYDKDGFYTTIAGRYGIGL